MNGNRLYQIAIGLLLVVGGIVLLLASQGLIRPYFVSLSRPVGLLLFGALGLAFLVAFVTNVHDRWSAAIPAGVLLGLAVMILFEGVLGEAAGAFFLACIGLPFLAIFLVRREFWWAVIPAGVLLTVAVIASPVVTRSSGESVPGILFLGLAGTFLLVYALPSAEGRRTWALWPAAILGIMGVAFSVAMTGLLRFIGPVLVIALGAIIVLRGLGKGK